MKIEFEVPDSNVYVKDRIFKELTYREKMYLYYLRDTGENTEYYDTYLEEWSLPNECDRESFEDSVAYRPALKDDEVDWAELPFDWVARCKSGRMFNFEYDPSPNESIALWEEGGLLIRIDQLLTTKNNGKYWTESKMKKPEEFKL